MPGTLQVKGRFSVPWSIQDAFGFVYPGAFLFGVNGRFSLTSHMAIVERCWVLGGKRRGDSSGMEFENLKGVFQLTV